MRLKTRIEIAQRKALRKLGIYTVKGWWIARQVAKVAAADAKIAEPWLKSFWSTLTPGEQQIYMSEYLGDGSWGGEKKFPEPQHVAFSSLPGVGRPLVHKEGGYVLNSDWECPEPQRTVREKWRQWHTDVEKLAREVGETEAVKLAHPTLAKHGTPTSFEELHAKLKKKAQAAKKLEKLLASPPESLTT